MHFYPERIIEYLATIIEWCSASVLLIGFAKTFIVFLKVVCKPGSQITFSTAFENLRATIGNYILLGLDFYIISDILHSMSAKDEMSLVRLGAVTLLRTLIGFFLGKEIKEHTEKKILS
jgi:uncharacterized membrane protein